MLYNFGMPTPASILLKDIDLRQALYAGEIHRHRLREPESRIIDELGIFEGKFRMDVAVVNTLLHGYEIKSDADNLVRLPNQQESYNKIFDKITLVAGESHVEEAFKILPSFWGLIAVSTISGRPVLKEIWPARLNPNVDAFSLCQLLWRDEVLSILRKKKLLGGLWSKPRKLLWQKLAREIDLIELKDLVRQTLKARKNWRR